MLESIKDSFFSWKKLFFPIILLLVVCIVFFRLAELKEIGRLLMSAQIIWLLGAFFAQFLIVFLQGNVYRVIFKILRFPHLKLWYLMKSTVLILFLNFTIPSLGFAGNIHFLKNLKGQGVKEGKGLMSVIIEFVCFYSAFVLLTIWTLGYLIYHVGFSGRIAKTSIYILPIFILLLLIICFLLNFWLGKHGKAKGRVLWFLKKTGLSNGNDEENNARVDEILKDFYQDLDWIKNHKKDLIKPTLIQLIKFIGEGLTIILVFNSFGQTISVGLALAAFAFSRLISLISFLPGGLGTFEGSLVLVLNSFGFQLELALMVMLVYRFFSYWLYFPVGIFFYHHLNQNDNFSIKYVK